MDDDPLWIRFSKWLDKSFIRHTIGGRALASTLKQARLRRGKRRGGGG